MHMTGEQRVFAPRERVWAALNDPGVLAQCLPQEYIQDGDALGWNAIAAGPLEARGAGHLRLAERDAPHACTIVGLGADVSGGMQTQARVRLSDTGQGHTLVSYDLSPHNEGLVHSTEPRRLDASAQTFAGNFFLKFGEVVGGEHSTSGRMAAIENVWAAPEDRKLDGNEVGAGPVWGWVGALVMAIVIGYMLGRTGSVVTTLGGIVMLIITAACAYEAGRKMSTT